MGGPSNTLWFYHCALPFVKCVHLYHSVSSTGNGASYSITLQPAQQARTLVLLALSCSINQSRSKQKAISPNMKRTEVIFQPTRPLMLAFSWCPDQNKGEEVSEGSLYTLLQFPGPVTISYRPQQREHLTTELTDISVIPQ